MIAFSGIVVMLLLEIIRKNAMNIEIQTSGIGLKLIPVYLNIQRLYMRDIYLEIYLGDLFLVPVLLLIYISLGLGFLQMLNIQRRYSFCLNWAR